jgi:hypothetical protein
MVRHELEQKLMRRLVDGLAGWATYHQACGAGRHYDEHLFYQHIERIALGRNWQVKQQQPIVGSTPAKGAPSTIDFVFFRKPGYQRSRRGLLFVEVKYLRGDHPTQDIENIRKDIDKLRGLQPASLANAPHLAQCGSPARFLLIVAQKSGLAATINLTSRDHADVVEMLRNARDDKPDLVYHAEGDAYIKDGLKWQVFAIGSARWPK